MIDIPTEIIAEFIELKVGSVLYTDEESFTSEEPHNLVILNHNPMTDEVLILVCATSDVASRVDWIRRSGFPSETLVIVDQNDCSFLKRQSVFNCNDVIKSSVGVVCDKYKNKKLNFKGCVSDEIIQKMQAGVIASPRVEESIKKLDFFSAIIPYQNLVFLDSILF